MKSNWQSILRQYRKDISKQRNKSRFISFENYEKDSTYSNFTEDPGILFIHTGAIGYQIGEDEFRSLRQGEHLFYPKGVTLTFEIKEDTFCTRFDLKRVIVEQFIELLKNYGSYPKSMDQQPNRLCIFQQTRSEAIDELLEEQVHQYFELNKDHDFFISQSLCKIMYHIFPDEHMLSKIVYLIETPFYPEAIQEVESYIIENYHQPLRMKQLLEVAMVSESNLSRLYKKYFGMSPMERLTTIRMEQAAQLLRNSSTTITEVAVQVGYQSMSAFVQQFKKKFGLSPKRFQSSHS
ncbi:AraC family transcriptional regulator [Cytobacillus sp. S13-E01]|uniref:helix-turn-helix domain-containing protein n=1 Tax=Cytobacillus sp. S13-E01 TaxID=3031326 RepID=UPI0023D7D00B|nr:AraC family transcriptional regulator [Cytobacillus sp. S13-E01]MDF0725593.1 AraC family transcriptional regulator [Cytobacillus sp. S13-E01]